MGSPRPALSSQAYPLALAQAAAWILKQSSLGCTEPAPSPVSPGLQETNAPCLEHLLPLLCIASEGCRAVSVPFSLTLFSQLLRSAFSLSEMLLQMLSPSAMGSALASGGWVGVRWNWLFDKRGAPCFQPQKPLLQPPLLSQSSQIQVTTSVIKTVGLLNLKDALTKQCLT